MPPRIQQSLSGSLARISSPASTSRVLARPFTCTSCRAQQNQQNQQIPTPTHLQSGSQQQSHPPAPQRRLPRWAATPERMRAPVSLKKHDPRNRYNVNEDPVRLDKAYRDVFGDGGEELLTEEVKWLAVTHKSFDQGRRGYNDRLAYLGKRIVDLQTSLAILAQPAEDGFSSSPQTDSFGREPFRHPAMDILPKLTPEVRLEHSRQLRLAALAQDFGLAAVVRWKPREAHQLEKSGQNFVLTQALYAMVGALALQRGGDTAVKAVRSRILPRLGLEI